MTPDSKPRRVHRLRFQRPSRRKQEIFVVLAIIVLILVVLAVILTLWQMPAANRQNDDGVHTVWTAPASPDLLLVARRQANRDRCALAHATVQLHCARVLVLNDPTT